jgi:hypothetical protein
MKAHSAYLHLLINYSVYRKLFGDEDSKIYKKIWSLQKMCPLIILYNSLSVNPGSFLTKKCPLKKPTKCDPKDLQEFLVTELTQKDGEFSKRLDTYYIKLVQWICKMNSDAMFDQKSSLIQDTDANIKMLQTRANLIITGLDMANEIKRTTKQLILMYQTCGKEPTKARLHDIVRSIELLKAIEIEFRSKRFIINQWVTLINRYTSEIID